MEGKIISDEAGKAVNNLIDKLAQCAGWIATRETPNKIAIDTYIKEIQESNLDPLTKAAFISNARKIIKEYSNQTKIIENASKYIEENGSPEKVDEDWISSFMDKAKLVSSDEFQQILGKIMAVECNTPNSIPKGLLHILTQMDRDDAKAFAILCAMTISSDIESAPVINNDKLDDYGKYGISFDTLVNLSALGLIQVNLDPVGTGYAIETRENPARIKYFDENRLFYGVVKYVRVGCALYTKAGQALYYAMQVEKIEGFWEEFCLPLWDE